MNINREMVQRLVGCLALLLVALAGSVGSTLPAEGQEVAPQGSGVYVEDFASYTYADYTDKLEWNPFTGSLSLRPVDAIPRIWSDMAYNGIDSVYVVWEDYRNGDSDIYMQRLDVSGNRLWEHDLRVNSDSGAYSQGDPAIDLEPDGSAIVIWEDYRNGQGDIYAQRISANGARMWTSDAMINITRGGGGIDVATDNLGNTFVSWVHCEGACEYPYEYGIYLQRLGVNGTRLWANDLRVAIAQSDYPVLTALDTDLDGNAVVAWNDGYIMARKVSSSGTLLWTEAVSLQVDGMGGWLPAVAVASSNDIYVAWQKSAYSDIYAQKVSSAGQVQWDNAVQLCNQHQTQSRYRVEIALDSAGGVVVVWDGYSGYPWTLGAWARRVDSAGAVHWDAPLRLSDLSELPTVAAGPSGQVFVSLNGVRVNRLDAVSGQLLKPSFARVSDSSGTADQQEPSLQHSSGGEVVVAWREPSAGAGHDVKLLSLNADGSAQWQNPVRANRPEGSVFYTPAYNVDLPPIQTAMNQAGEIFAVWTDSRGPGETSVYAQKVDTEGNALWPNDLLVGPGGDAAEDIAAMPDGGAVIAYRHIPITYTDTITGGTYIQRVSADGQFLWGNGVWIDDDSCSEVNLAVTASRDIYVNNGYIWRLNSSGDILWRTARSYREGEDSAIAVDGNSNALVVWADWKSGSGYYIYAQKLDGGGVEMWGEDRQVSLSTGSSHFSRPDIAIDADGFAVVVWGLDYHDGIYAQRITADGATTWSSDVQASDELGDLKQYDPSVVVDEAGTAYVAWTDERNRNGDIYMQRLSVSGERLWASDRQVMAPDFSCFPTGTAQSRSVDTTDDSITEATLTAQYILQGGNVSFYLTNDGGVNWAQVTPGVTHVFTTTGSDLRWWAELIANSVWRHRAPVVEQIRIEYQTASANGDDYEMDDTCAQAQPIAVNGAAQQHTFHDAGDADWAWFEATAGMTYIIQTANTGPGADTVLELWDACGGSLEGRDDDAFASGSSLVWTCPTSGAYYVKVMNHDPNDYGPNASYDLSVRTYYASNPVAIIAAGHNDSYVLQANINHAANWAYLTFLDAGFARPDVYYLNPDPNQDVDGNGSNDDIGAVTTVTSVREAIQTWARERVGLGVPLFIYLIDHGNEDIINADGNNDRITAPELDLWLSNLEATTGCDMITVIIEACHSGSFIDVTQYGPAEISGHNRVVVASTSSQLNAFPSPQGAAFSDAFFTALGDNQDVWTAFRAGVAAVEATGRLQTPWLDDNGDAVYDATDGDLARSRGLAAFFGGGIPVIDWVQAGEVSEGGSATIQAQVRDDLAVADVTAVIYPPLYEEPAPGEIIPELDVPTMTLTLAGTNVYAGTSGVFTETGAYQVVVYAQDNEGNQAIPQWILVGEKRVYLPLVLR